MATTFSVIPQQCNTYNLVDTSVGNDNLKNVYVYAFDATEPVTTYGGQIDTPDYTFGTTLIKTLPLTYVDGLYWIKIYDTVSHLKYYIPTIFYCTMQECISKAIDELLEEDCTTVGYTDCDCRDIKNKADKLNKITILFYMLINSIIANESNFGQHSYPLSSNTISDISTLGILWKKIVSISSDCCNCNS